MRLHPLQFALLVVSCLVTVACTRRAETAYDLLQRDSYWTLAHGDAFGDGSSRTLSFIDSKGQIIHLWAQAPLNTRGAERQFFLKRTYDDPAAVEVLPASTIEQRVIELLGSYRRPSHINIPDSYFQHFAAMLRDRTRPFPEGDDWTKSPDRYEERHSK